MSQFEKKINQATTKDHISFINIVVSLFGAILLWFISYALFFGNEEDLIKLKENLPFSFLDRFGVTSILGFIGIACLFLINLLLNYTILRNQDRINLIKIALLESVIVVFGALLGTTMFFYG